MSNPMNKPSSIPRETRQVEVPEVILGRMPEVIELAWVVEAEDLRRGAAEAKQTSDERVVQLVLPEPGLRENPCLPPCLQLNLRSSRRELEHLHDLFDHEERLAHERLSRENLEVQEALDLV